MKTAIALALLVPFMPVVLIGFLVHLTLCAAHVGFEIGERLVETLI